MCSKRLPNRLIKKSFRAYNTRCQLVLFVLPDGEVFRLFPFQFLKQQIDVVLKLLVVLVDLHRVDHLDQRGEALFLVMPLIVDVPDEGRVEQGFRLDPKIVPGLGVAGGVGDQGRYQLQNILFRMDIGKGVVVHGLLEVDGVKDADSVALLLQQRSALHGDAALGVCDHEGAGVSLRCALHEVGLKPEAGLAAAGAADHQHVFVPCRLGVLWPIVHGQALGLRQDDVVGKDGIDVGRDVLRRSPAGRAVFHVFSELLGILALDVDRQPDQACRQDAYAEIDRVKAGGQGRKRRFAALQNMQGLCGEIRARSQPCRLPQLGAQQREQKIGAV